MHLLTRQVVRTGAWLYGRRQRRPPPVGQTASLLAPLHWVCTRCGPLSQGEEGMSRQKTQCGILLLDKIRVLKGVKPRMYPLGYGALMGPNRGGVCVFPCMLVLISPQISAS